MAKKLKDEDLVLNIIINGNKSKKEMNELERAIGQTNQEINTLKRVQKDLIAQGKKETDAYRATVVAIEEKNKAIAQAEARLTQLRKGMKLTEMSLTDLRKEQQRLNKLLSTATPGSANAIAYQKQLDAISGRLTELKAKAVTTGFTLKGMADKFNHYIGVITAGVVTLVGLLTGLQRIITTFAEFDDKVADVQKTTGLLKEDVLELNEELKKIRTRTAQEDLLGLSRVAGKLGISAKEDILGFVKATDQIGVALAEDLGGDVEEAINQVGKLVDIFQLKGEFGIEKALLKVGSTINELGASSTANEGYLVNFTNRMAGVAPLAGVTIQQVLGLGATLDQFGQTAEVSSTALSKLFMKMASDADKYSKYAGMSVNEFKTSLEKDFMGTFIKVLDGVKSNAGGINELADSLGDLGLDGGRVVGVLGTLANNTFILKQQLDLANTSFADGMSLTNEFGIKNETAAAKLDMAKKVIYNMTVELGEKLYPAMTLSINGFTMMVKVLSVLIGFIVDNRKAIATVMAALIGYNSVVLITNFITGESILLKKAEIALAKLKVFWDTAQTAALHLLGAGYLLLRGEIAAAKAEMILFNTVTKMNPLAMLVAVLAAAVVGISMYTRKLTDAEKAQRTLNELMIEANKATAETKNRTQALQSVLENELATRNEKLTAIKQLRELMPEHLKGYSDEQILAGQAARAISLYVQQLERRARVDASARKLAELDAQRDEINKKRAEGLKGASIGDRLIAGFSKNNVDGYIKMLQEQEKDIDKAQAVIRKKMDADIRGNYDLSTIDGMQMKADEMYMALGKLKKGTLEYKNLLADIQSLNYSIAFRRANPEGSGKLDLGESEKDRKARLKAEKEAAAASNKQRKEDLAAENLAYQEKLKAAGLFGLQKNLMTAEQLEQLAALEKEHQENINAINEKGNRAAIEKTSQALTEIKKRQEAEKTYRESLKNPESELIEQESQAHQQRLEKAGLFGKKREDLTKDQIEAIESLEAIHKAKLNKVDASLMKQEIDQKQAAYNEELADLRVKNNTELLSLKTFAEAKKLLEKKLPADQLRDIKTFEQAKKALKKFHLEEENKISVKYAEDLIKKLEATIKSGDFEGIKLSDKIISPEEKKALEKQILELKELLSKLHNPEGEEENPLADFDKLDILGMSGADWHKLYDNLKDGKIGIDDLTTAATGLINIWGQYNKIVSNGEQKQLAEFEKSSDEKKKALQSQLSSGKLTQKKYADELAKIDLDLDQKRAETDRNAAVRDRNVALMSAIVNTAAGVAKALPNLVLAAIVGAAGALQIGTIMSTPLPVIPGKEEGGYVTRAQDGKEFKAKHQGNKRGYIDETSVLVSENGREFVASAAAVANPEIKQVLDMIDSAQRNGNVSTLTLEKMMYTSSASRKMNGKENGGYVSSSTFKEADYHNQIEMLMAMYQGNNEVLKKLTELLSKPIDAKVALLGPNGFIEQQANYQKVIDQNTL